MLNSTCLFHQLVFVFFLLLNPSVSPFSTPSPIPKAESESSIKEASDFFISNYYPTSTPALYDLSSTQFSSDYAPLLTKRTFPSSLYFSSSIGLICGQTCLLSNKLDDLIRPKKSLEIYNEKMSYLGPKQRREFKGKSIYNIIPNLLPEYTVTTLISNLIIPPSFRRKGYAQNLLLQLESSSETGSMSLFVNSKNIPAISLYEKLGYVSAGKTEGNKEVYVKDDGEVGERDVEEVFMIKNFMKSGGI
ncbi:hypothetical protein TL16_g10101 [Triparma laevis f. inornata]|uniref:N-acetyltransferase domain-containing protein n=1 Tax=Triparma laevis f. inornata TaxID=1714386 RepID=A0A9W7BF53_9STRA|nr:hypothetical protein TL16_g10101 [Triparma laevis f. inornata]